MSQDLFQATGTIFENKMSDLTILSMGVGQDSITILYKIVFDADFKAKYAPERLLILFADTHEETPETYDYLERVLKPFCKEYDLDFVHITNDMGYHGESWKSLSTQWASGERRTIGSVAYPKTCTSNLKLQPQYRYVEQWLFEQYEYVTKASRKAGFIQFAKYYGKIRWLIGISKGEEKRVADAENDTFKWRKQSIELVYPLIEEGLGRQECQDYIRSVGMEIPFPSNCLKCPFLGANKMELLWMYMSYPDKFEEWAEEEDAKLQDHQDAVKNLGVCGKLHKDGERKGKAVTLLDTLEEAKAMYPDITLDELTEYRFSHGHCAVSVY